LLAGHIDAFSADGGEILDAMDAVAAVKGLLGNTCVDVDCCDLA
jgi:hypothetical protein